MPWDTAEFSLSGAEMRTSCPAFMSAFAMAAMPGASNPSSLVSMIRILYLVSAEIPPD